MMEQRKSSSLWRSRVGFVLAALGSALGLGSLWKFPYICAENGGGLFVIVYLACIALLGVPLMIAEVLLGRSAHSSPVRAFKLLARSGGRAWQTIGVIGVVSGVTILSYYGVVAGWSLHYLTLSVTGALPLSNDPTVYEGVFTALLAKPGTLVFWHVVVMLITAAIVLKGVQSGVEAVSKWLMGILFVILVILLGYSTTLPTFWSAFWFVFGFHSEKFTANSVLEALGHAFFTLSLGMGAMMTYGSYLDKKDKVVGMALTVSVMDTIASLIACLVVYPVTSAGGIIDPDKGPGLVYINLPVAVQSLPGGAWWLSLFFVLLFVAALASAVSLLEVPVSVLIDSLKMRRAMATAVAGGAITVLGVPTALSSAPNSFFNEGMKGIVGSSWFDFVDHLSSNWLLPLGGLGVCAFIAFAMNRSILEREFGSGPRWVYRTWFASTVVVAPLLIISVFLRALGVM